MKFIADFHLHSKYSRATSPQICVESLDRWARIKGVQVLGTSDFTHPQWLAHLKENLKPAEPGLYSFGETRFLLTSEISCIYSKGSKVRKVHILVFAPDFETVEKINAQLGWIGNLKSDGRPILGLDAKELAKIVLNISDKCFVVPCHVMTPWFSVFGSKSGFDSLEECFEDYTKHIYALETGLSADPAMLWRIPDGRKVTLISNSDAHSPSKIGREANVFDTEMSYVSIINAIKSRDPKKFLYTIEFYPQEGKYHYDGHRKCDIVLSPLESKKYNNICPVCGKPLTIGVANRIEEISDRPQGFQPENVVPFKSLVPLPEIIAESFGCGVASKKVEQEYYKIIELFGSEFEVLLNSPFSSLKTAILPEIVEGIKRVREERLHIEPGFDGVYGKVGIFTPEERKQLSKQETLF